jgi:hypothetical protein
MLKITLTSEQKEQLEPLFAKVREANHRDELVCIGAQIWPDGMVVRVFREDQGRALAAALGGDFDRHHYSAAERFARFESEAAAGVPASSHDQKGGA